VELLTNLDGARINSGFQVVSCKSMSKFMRDVLGDTSRVDSFVHSLLDNLGRCQIAKAYIELPMHPDFRVRTVD